jgi:hypothetical protein
LGQRSRKRRPAVGAPKPRPSGAERDAAARAALTPVGPGERPVALVISVAVAVLLAAANLIAYAVGTKIQGKHPGAGVLSFSAVLGLAAFGMWRMRYWAVLGFQALLALIVLAFALLLTRASNALGVVVALAVVGGGVWLFWRMVQVMARIQLPSRERPGSVR